MTERIVQEFNNKNHVELRDSSKAMARLLREINTAKKTLSANKIATVRVENIIRGINLVHEFSRDNLHDIINISKEKLVEPLKRLFNRLNVSINEVNAFELIGGVSRIPRIQEILEAEFKVKFSTHIDPNEAIAHGTALYAAKDSSTVTVKPLIFTDVFTCITYLKNDNEKIVLFDQLSQLGSTKKIKITVEEGKILTLVNECDEDIAEYYRYVFEQSGELNLDFTLDRNGLAFLSKSLNSDSESANYTKTDISDPAYPTKSQMIAIRDKILSFKSNEKIIKQLAEAKNSIETVVYYIKDKIEEKSYITVTTDEERKKYSDHINEIKEWIDSDEFKLANTTDIETRINSVREMMFESFEREQEYNVRNKMIEQAEDYFAKLTEFLANAAEVATWVPKEEIDSGWEELNNAKKWFDETIEKQKELQPWETPIFSSKALDDKFTALRKKLEKIAYSKPKSSNTKKPAEES